ncbi:hypothetical protein [Streptomyces sp. NPDC018045]|uniref:hypothetical protein n=1 Tax=Streptomyces sp. NPDC018045 TaxID=3365037 RepID=UPI00379E370F
MRLRPVLATAAAVLSLSATGLTGAALAAAPADPAPPVTFGNNSGNDGRGEQDHPGTIGWGHKPYQLLGDRDGRYVITAVNKTDSDRLPTCYRDLYATPSSSICH